MNIKLVNGGKMPERMTAHAAGYDMFANEDRIIAPGSRFKMPLGVCFDIPNDAVGTLSHRSGMNTKQGIWCFGRIDADYQGEVFATLLNTDPSHYVHINRGDRVAQIVFGPYYILSMNVVEEFNYVTDRGDKGYGSTGA